MVQTAFLGDVLLSIPFLRRLRLRHPGATLGLVARSKVAEVLLDLGLIDELWEIQKGSSKSYGKLAQDLAHREFAMVYCPHPSLRSALLVRKLRAKHRIAFASFWNFLFFDQLVPRHLDLPEPLRLLSLVDGKDPLFWPKATSFRNWRGTPAIPVEWSMQISEQKDNKQARDNTIFGFSDQKVLCLFPGSVWGTKAWRKEGFIEVGRVFLQRGWRVLVLGAASESSLCQSIAAQLGPDCVSLAGSTSIPESLKVLRSAQLVIANDSASQHLASLAGVPCVSVFGPTVVEQGFRPWSNLARVVSAEPKLSCQPCGPHGGKRCPLQHHRCMELVSASQVVAAADSLL